MASSATEPPSGPAPTADLVDTDRTVGEEPIDQGGDYETALAYRNIAQETLQGGDLRGKSKERLLDDLNGTYAFVLDENRVDSSAVFHADRTLVARTQQRHSEVAAYVTAADANLASTAITDAERVADQLVARNVSFDEAAVRANITEARTAYGDGLEHQENGRLVVAVVEYERAWTNAQYALARMDRAVDPIVEITHREDPPHDGNLTYSVDGTVYDVHTANVNATVAVGGEERELVLNGSTVPGTVATFNDTLLLEEQVNTVTVTAENPAGTFVSVDATPATDARTTEERSDKKGRGSYPKNTAALRSRF